MWQNFAGATATVLYAAEIELNTKWKIVWEAEQLISLMKDYDDEYFSVQ